MDLSIIDDIKGKYTQKIIKRNCNRILKKCSPKSSVDLSYILELTTVLYTLGAYEDVIKVSNILDDISFDGNYTLWSNVRKTRLIKYKVLQDKGLKKEAQDILDTIMRFEHMELWENQIEILEICDVNIAEAQKYGLKREELFQKIFRIGEMIRFLSLPGFPIKKNKITSELTDAIIDLRSLLK